MAKGNGGWGYLRSALGGTDRGTLRRWAIIWFALVGLGWFYLIPKFVSAQDKKPEEMKPAGAAPATAPAPAPAAPAAAPADSGPKGDPNGTNTGDESTAIDASGTAF